MKFLRVSRQKKSGDFYPAGLFFLVLQVNVYRSALIPRELPCPKKILLSRLSPNGIKLRPGEFINVDMKQMPEQIIAACVPLPTRSKMDLEWKAFNISQQITTFATQINLLTHHRNCVLNWLIEVPISFFSTSKKQELSFLATSTTLNKGMEELKVNYSKT